MPKSKSRTRTASRRVKPAMRVKSATRDRRPKPAKRVKSTTRSRRPKPAKSVAATAPTHAKYLTLAEAAERVRLSKPTIVRAYRSGALRVFRTPLGGRVLIHADSLDAWIERNSFGGRR